MFFFFSKEKRNGKEHSSAMNTWRQGNCSKGRSSNAGPDSETQIRQRRKLLRKAIEEKGRFHSDSAMQDK